MNFAAHHTYGTDTAQLLLFIKYFLVVAITALLLCTAAAAEEAPRRFPCDPKFGLLGNYIEITVSAVTGDNSGLQVCFEPEKHVKEGMDCLNLEDMPGRYKTSAGWSAWQTRLPVDKGDRIYQYGLCGDKNDDSVWHNFHKGRGTDSWDGMRLRNTTTGSIFVDSVRVVQNRVRILDNESLHEGILRVTLGAAGQRDADLSPRIRRSKIDRVSCLNLKHGPPYCEERISGLDPESLPPVIKKALLELGHSGSQKFGRENNAWCSEFALFVIDASVQLSKQCSKNIPSPSKGDLNANSMFQWFSACGRVIPRDRLKMDLQPGDYLSTGERTHSNLFLGWADPEKNFFWEISGNNKCRPEVEAMIAPTFMGNMVCIAKHEFMKDVGEKDFGGRTGP